MSHQDQVSGEGTPPQVPNVEDVPAAPSGSTISPRRRTGTAPTPMGLPEWITIFAWLIMIAGVIGSIVLAVNLAESEQCDASTDLFGDFDIDCENRTDSGTAWGVAIAGIVPTLVLFFFLMTCAAALRLLKRIADNTKVADPVKEDAASERLELRVEKGPEGNETS